MINITKGNDIGGDFIAGDKNQVYVNISNEVECDLGIINEIFQYIINNKRSHKYTDKKNIDVSEKIKLNFIGNEDEIHGYFTNAYTYISLIDEVFSDFDSYDQEDIHGDIKFKYNSFKHQEYDSIRILNELVNNYSPPNKKKNPTYTRMAIAIVLFFFEDCTWGIKTDKEKNEMFIGG